MAATRNRTARRPFTLSIEDMAGLTVGIVVLLAALAVASSVLTGRGGWSSAFEQIALRYGGWYSPARLLRPPASSFRYKNADCRVRCLRRWPGRPRQSTQLRIAWPGPELRLEIRGPGQPSGLRGGHSLEPVSIAESGFGQRFACWSTHQDLARRLVTPGVVWQLDQLQRTGGAANPRVAIERGWLTVSRQGFVRHSEPLDDFVRYALELYDQMLLTLSEGIEFEDHVISALDEMQCPVCSSDIESQMVICVRCKTPHCHDCWVYNGKCGMYACAETRFSMVGGGQG